VRTVRSRITELEPGIASSERLLERLRERYADEALRAVGRNPSQARELVVYAERNLGVAEDRLESRRAADATAPLQTAEEAVHRAGQLVAAVERFEVDALRAESTLAAVIADTESDIVDARRLVGSLRDVSARPEIERAIARAQDALTVVTAPSERRDPGAYGAHGGRRLLLERAERREGGRLLGERLLGRGGELDDATVPVAALLHGVGERVLELLLERERLPQAVAGPGERACEVGGRGLAELGDGEAHLVLARLHAVVGVHECGTGTRLEFPQLALGRGDPPSPGPPEERDGDPDGRADPDDDDHERDEDFREAHGEILRTSGGEIAGMCAPSQREAASARQERVPPTSRATAASGIPSHVGRFRTS
jgi:hypothetical protein